MNFDVLKQNDSNYLIKYYQSRIDKWKNNPNGLKIVEHYENLIKQLKNKL